MGFELSRSCCIVETENDFELCGFRIEQSRISRGGHCALVNCALYVLQGNENSLSVGNVSNANMAWHYSQRNPHWAWSILGPTLNHSCNVFIYIASNSTFRQELVLMFTKGKWKAQPGPATTTTNISTISATT